MSAEIDQVFLIRCDHYSQCGKPRTRVRADSLRRVNDQLKVGGWQISTGGMRHYCPEHHLK